jgi:2-polyprenyl-3-methyl-5-hydroxy-6-metoxy-1,4-benzoquinol methylase
MNRTTPLSQPRDSARQGRTPTRRYRWNPHPHGTHAVVLRLVPPDTRVLDVGCASGYLGRGLRARGCETSGIDADGEAIASARPFYRDVRQVDLDRVDELPWDESSFDVVVVADVLEHLLDPRRSLRLLTRYVRDGGYVVVSLPNVAHVSVRLPLLFGRFSYRDTGILDRTHLHLYTWNTALELARSCGLEVVQTASGSDLFGRLLNGWTLAGRVMRGLAATNIVLLCRVRKASDPAEGTRE